MTPSQEILEKYKRIEKRADALGRVIGVGFLRMSQKIKVSEMTPGLEGETEVKTPDGNTIAIPRRAYSVIAASVREIQEPNGDKGIISFPRNRGELDAIVDRLDEQGFHRSVRSVCCFEFGRNFLSRRGRKCPSMRSLTSRCLY